MKKVYLSVIGFSLLCRLNAHSQTLPLAVAHKPATGIYSPVTPDTSTYQARQLHLDEVNFISSYYAQNGNHSAVTGGIGTENVIDVSNGIDLKFAWTGETGKKNSLTAGFGYDYHTSASSAFVTTTGNGKKDGTRVYPSLDWTVENPNGTSLGLGSYYSGEYNYKSFGTDIHFSAQTKDKSGEFGIKVQAYWDQVTLIYPSEFIAAIAPAPAGATYITTASGNKVLSSSAGGGATTKSTSLPTSPRNTYSASLSYSQIINERLQVMFLGDVVTQNGLLSLPFHRVYFTNKKDTIEKLPSSRFKVPIGFRLNYFAGDNVIFRTYYRYYTDNWGINASTASLEVAFKMSPFLSLSPFYRFYTQTAARYFAPYEVHAPTDQFYTSNYEYAAFQSNYWGVGIRLAPPTGVFGLQGLHDLEIRYGHYSQSTQLASDVISLNLGFK